MCHAPFNGSLNVSGHRWRSLLQAHVTGGGACCRHTSQVAEPALSLSIYLSISLPLSPSLSLHAPRSRSPPRAAVQSAEIRVTHVCLYSFSTKRDAAVTASHCDGTKDLFCIWKLRVSISIGRDPSHHRQIGTEIQCSMRKIVYLGVIYVACMK
jgi:hypothetical protein